MLCAAGGSNENVEPSTTLSRGRLPARLDPPGVLPLSLRLESAGGALTGLPRLTVADELRCLLAGFSGFAPGLPGWTVDNVVPLSMGGASAPSACPTPTGCVSPPTDTDASDTGMSSGREGVATMGIDEEAMMPTECQEWKDM